MITEAAVPTKRNKMPDWSAIRADFRILDQQVHGQPLIYFDNAATTQKPRAVLEACAAITSTTTPMSIAAFTN